MVYGGPSRGCMNCRKRHIKCDGGRPQCQSCIKRKETCPGYKDEFDVMLKDQTAIVPERHKRRPVARGKQRASQDISLSMPPPIPLDSEVVALCIFFTSYVAIARDPSTSCGFLEYLIPIYSQAHHESPLSLATSAVAVLIMSMRSGRGPDNPVSHSLFGQALNLTKVAINDPLQNKTDETLVTVLMLEMYERLAHQAKSQISSGAHHSGAIALVRHRGYINFQSEQAKRLLIALRHQLIQMSLQKCVGITPDSDIWDDAALMPQNPAIQLDNLAAELANLQALGKTFQFPPPPAPSSRSPSPSSFHAPKTAVSILHSILAPALDLDSRLAVWSKSVPPFWQPIAVSSPSCVDSSIEVAGMYGPSCDVYPSLHIASIWNSYRITRISILLIILKCHRALVNIGSLGDHVPEAARIYAMTTIQRLVDAVCDSVPQHLGNRTQSQQFGWTEGVHYPQLPDTDEGDFLATPSPHALGYSVTMSRYEHLRIADAVGGCFLLGPLGSILAASSTSIPSPISRVGVLGRQQQQRRGSQSPIIDYESQPLLRDGQREWIAEQLERIKRIYHIGVPRTSPKSTASPSSASAR